MHDWTEDDWRMLFLGIEALKRKIGKAQAKRKAKPPCETAFNYYDNGSE